MAGALRGRRHPPLHTGATRLIQSLDNHVLIRYRRLPDPPGMASLARKIDAERRMRDLLEMEGIPQPDAVEYGHTCVRLFWTKSKHCVIVDLDGDYEVDGNE